MASIANTLAGPEPFKVKAKKMLVKMNTLGGSDMAVLRVPDEAEEGLRAIVDSGPSRLRAKPIPLLRYGGQTVTALAYELGEPIVVNDYAAHPQALPTAVAQGVNSLAVLPLKVGQVTLGTVNLNASEKHYFTPECIQLLAAVASERGVLVENARLHAETEHRLEELHAAQLFISPRTVETHRANFMRKLHLRTQADPIRYALERGILPMES
jgi:GAF domain-containing protein